MDPFITFFRPRWPPEVEAFEVTHQYNAHDNKVEVSNDEVSLRKVNAGTQTAQEYSTAGADNEESHPNIRDRLRDP
jgi:hypothetical protein